MYRGAHVAPCVPIVGGNGCERGAEASFFPFAVCGSCIFRFRPARNAGAQRVVDRMVTEACGNAVRHAYPDGLGDVAVSYVVRGDVIEILVEDQGTGLEAVAVPDEPVTVPVDGGMGLAIMRTIADELEVRTGSDGRGTTVRMTKRLPTADVR